MSTPSTKFLFFAFTIIGFTYSQTRAPSGEKIPTLSKITFQNIPTLRPLSGSGGSAETNLLHEILIQETDLRLELQKNVQSLFHDVSALKSDRDTLMKENKMLKEQYGLLKSEYDILNSTCCGNREQIEKDVGILKQDRDSLRQEVNSLMGKNKILQDEYDILKGEFDILNYTCARDQIENTKIMSSVNDVKKEYHYVSLSLLNLHTKTDNLNTTITRSVDDNIRKVTTRISHEINSLTQSQQLTEQIQMEHSKASEAMNKTLHDVSKTLLRTEHMQAQLSDDLTDITRNITNRITAAKSKLSFTACISSAKSSYSVFETIIFPNVTTNIGGGYSPLTGVFTSPTDGTFVFHFSITSTSSEIIPEMMLNGRHIVYGYAFDYRGRATAVNMAVLRLQSGDKVWIRHVSGSGVWTYSSKSLSSFSGFLL